MLHTHNTHNASAAKVLAAGNPVAKGAPMVIDPSISEKPFFTALAHPGEVVVNAEIVTDPANAQLMADLTAAMQRAGVDPMKQVVSDDAKKDSEGRLVFDGEAGGGSPGGAGGGSGGGGIGGNIGGQVGAASGFGTSTSEADASPSRQRSAVGKAAQEGLSSVNEAGATGNVAAAPSAPADTSSPFASLTETLASFAQKAIDRAVQAQAVGVANAAMAAITAAEGQPTAPTGGTTVPGGVPASLGGNIGSTSGESPPSSQVGEPVGQKGTPPGSPQTFASSSLLGVFGPPGPDPITELLELLRRVPGS